jgi:hypothetical protein
LFSSLGRTWQVFKFLLLTFACVALGACSTTSTVSVGSNELPSRQFSDGRGGVAFRLTVSGVGISPFFAFWHQTVLTQVEGAKKGEDFVVAMSDAGATGSATYFGALPEGRYEIRSFSSGQCGYLCVGASAKMSANAIRFDVVSGRITYLGSLIYERVDEKSARLLASGTADRDSLQTWLAAYFPTISSMPIADAGLEGNANVRTAEFRKAQDHAAGLLSPTVLSNGDVLFTTLSGSLKRYSVSSGLTTVNTGVASRVNAVVALTDRRWVAAGDFAEVRYTEDAGTTWSNTKLNLPYGSITGLYKASNGDVIVVLDRNPTLALYTGDFAANKWVLHSSSDYKRNIWAGGMSRPVIQFVASTGELLVVVPGGRSLILNTKSMVASEFDYPGGLMNIGLSGDGVLRCRCNRSGAWVSTWESRDRGKTWQDSPLDRALPIPVFRDKRLGMNTKQFDIQKTADGGATWKTVHTQKAQYWPFPLFPYSLSYVYVGDNRVLATDSMYKLLVSEDSGDTWKQVPAN